MNEMTEKQEEATRVIESIGTTTLNECYVPVSNRRELLISFATFMEANFFSDTAMTPTQLVDEYEREINSC